ncbi:MAG: UvrD-helicase domain-containing protein [Alphaproteobacteria bacterium]
MPNAPTGAAPAYAPPGWLDGLNEAQQEAVQSLDGPLLVLAGAGTGKTRVLTTRLANIIHCGKAKPYQLLCVTFTNKAAREMRDRVSALIGSSHEGLWLGTFHALGVRILRRHAELVGLKSGFTILDTDDQIRLLKQILEVEGIDDKRWPARMLIHVIQRWKDKGLTPDRVNVADAGEVANGRAIDIYRQYQERLLTLNAADFGDLLLHNLTIFTQHPDILKQYQNLFRYILVDEYQDTNVSQYLWLRLLAKEHKNICCVGDDDQCVAEDTPVVMADNTERPVQDIRPGDSVASNYGGGAVRPARVLRATRRTTNEKLVRIRTEAGRDIVSTAEHTHFADIVHSESPQKFYTYLMEKRGVGFRLGTSQIYTKSQKKPVIGFRQRCLQEHADAVWLLDAFDSENDAREREHRLSLEYGITTFPFVARKGGSSKGLVHDQARLDRLHADLGSEDRAMTLLQAYSLNRDRPHHIPQSSRGRRKVLHITLNAENRGATPMHGIAISGNDPQDREAVKALGLNPRVYKRNPDNWRYESLFRDFSRVDDLRRQLSGVFDLTVACKARLMKDRRALAMCAAAEVRPGMVMVGRDGEPDVVLDVSTVSESRPVYDLDIEGTHNFIASGLVTHNSIYGWRGAEVGNILRFEKDFPGAKVIRLERNYRSTPNILAAASGLIAKNEGRLGKTLWTEDRDGEPVRVRGVWDGEEEAREIGNEIESLQSKKVPLDEIAILVRAGFQTREFEERLITLGVPYKVVGGARFYEREEIRDAIAYLRVIAQPADDLAFERIINKPARKIGKATIQAIHGLQRITRDPMFYAAKHLVSTEDLKPAARTALARIMDDFDRWQGMAAGVSHLELTETVLDESGYTAMWQESKKPEAPGKLENLKELLVGMEDFETLPEFLEHISLVMDNESRSDEPQLSIMTLHGAKGLEFDVVFLPGWEEGLFPSQRTMDENGMAGLEEERRLAYVGLTRARKQAFISFAANRRIHGQWTSAIPSRFVSELPPDQIEEDSDRGLYAGIGGGRAEDRAAYVSDGFGGGFSDSPGRFTDATPRRFGSLETFTSEDGGPGWKRLRNKGPGRTAPPVIDGQAIATHTSSHDFGEGERCFHQKFGPGTVMAVDGDHLTIDFDKAGTKKVVASFVQRG